MSHLLDANACIDHMRHGSASNVSIRISAAPAGSVYLCSIVVGELLFGARISQKPTVNSVRVHSFCQTFTSLPFDDLAADEYSSIRAHLSKVGQPIGPNDMLIAAIARAHRLTLVTHNTADFGRIPGLNLEDWQ